MNKEANDSKQTDSTKVGEPQGRLILIFSVALIAVVIIPMLYFSAGNAKPKPQPEPDKATDQEAEPDIKIEAVAGNGAGARVLWKGVPVLHLEEEVLAGTRNGLARGAAISELWPQALSPKATWEAFTRRAPKDEVVWAEDLFANVLSDPSPLLRGGWLPDLVRETQGRASPEIAELQRLLLATNLANFVHVDALACDSAIGPILAAEISSPLGPPVGEWLTPIVYHSEVRKDPATKPSDDHGQWIFMLGAFGHSAPIAGMNLDGMALVRAPMGYHKEHSIVAPGGPDALTETRILLMRHRYVGLDQDEIGPDLIQLSETQMITRLSTPSALLATDVHESYRYEWSAVGASAEKSGALEFTKLEKGQTLPATGLFLSSEKRDARGAAYRSPLAQELKDGAEAEEIDKWVRSAQTSNGRTPARIVFIPIERRVLFAAGGKVLDLSLGRASGVRWDKPNGKAADK